MRFQHRSNANASLYANRRHGLAEEIDRKCECSINIMPNPPKGPYRLHEERQ